MKTFRWKVKPDMEVNSQPSVREVRFGDGYSQRMAAGLNADLKTYRVMLSVTREEARHLEAFLAEHGGWKAFLWKPPYAYRQIKVTFHQELNSNIRHRWTQQQKAKKTQL